MGAGRLNYISPELLNEDKNACFKADIWALGCCFYFLVTKKDPFTCQNPMLNSDKIKQNIREGVLDMPDFQ